MSELPQQIAELYEAGGFVMPGLVLAALLLWYALGWRYLTLRAGIPDAVRALPLRDPDWLLEALELQRAELGRGRTLVRSVVAVAPLAGLLGTVTGMIETFRSLGEMELFTQGGGIAGGIGEALLTTQMGLAVAVPGIVLGRLLDRRQATLEDQLDRMVDQARIAAAKEAA